MSIFGELEQHLIDWNDVYTLYDYNVIDEEGIVGEYDDISYLVRSVGYTYGCGILNDDNDFTSASAFGRLVLNGGLPSEITQDQLRRPHIYRHLIGGVLIFQCIAMPISENRFRLVSPNQAARRTKININYTEVELDAKLWNDAMSQAGVSSGGFMIFNGYELTAALDIEMEYGQFLNKFMEFAGGYAYEDKYCRMNFAAVNGLTDKNFVDVIDDGIQDIFTFDITSKEGAVRNQASEELVAPSSISREKLQTYNLVIPALGFREFYYNLTDKLGTNWSAVITQPSPVPDGLITRIENSRQRDVTFIVINGTEQEVTVQVELHAHTYSIASRLETSGLRVGSVLLYGRQPFEAFPSWGRNTLALQNELNRRSKPVNVAKIRMPIIPEVGFFGNDSYWLNLEVGDIVRVQDGANVYSMMIGSKTVESDDTFELEWHLVEVDTDDVKDAWYADDPLSILGVNTYLTNAEFVRGDFLTVGGKYVTIGGHRVLIPSLDLLAVDSDFLTIGGVFITIGLTRNGD